MSLIQTVVHRAGRLGLTPPKGLHKFLGVGFVGLAVDLGLLSILEHVGLHLLGARAISMSLATVVTWTLNRRHTFTPTGRKAHHEAMRYILVTLFAQSVNYVVMIIAAGLAPRLPHVVAAFIGSVVATLFSYTGQRYFTFAPEAVKSESASV